MKMSAEERFWLKVDKSGDCWEWTGRKNAGGYGTHYFNGKHELAHRLSWSFANGDIPKGNHHGTMCICHSCDTPYCVNPAHLFLSDQLGNIADRHKKGRNHSPTGTLNPKAKLCEVDVRLIRDLDAPNKDIAEWLDIPQGTVWNIKNHKTWKHVI